MKGDAVCPWTQEQIDAFQKRIDSAFGAEKALVLAWSYDRTYWDEFFMDEWNIFGDPTTPPQKTPILLFKQFDLNDKDRFYVSWPRWMILEKHHGSQLTDWEQSAYTADDQFIGGKKRIRRETAPEFFYVQLDRPLGVLARHEKSSVIGGPNPCCVRRWEAAKSICYGSYRDPSDEDIAAVRQIRINMDKAGVAQRNDAPRSAKMLEAAAESTRHHMKMAERQMKLGIREMIMNDPEPYIADIIKNYGITMSSPEIERTLREGFARQEETI